MFPDYPIKLTRLNVSCILLFRFPREHQTNGRKASRLVFFNSYPQLGLLIDTAEAFLRSILPVKDDAPTGMQNPPLAMKELSHESGQTYEPSSELLATFATLPGHLLTGPSPNSTATPSVVVKHEADAGMPLLLPSFAQVVTMRSS